MSNEQDISHYIQQIAGRQAKKPLFVTAEVLSVEGETCTVLRDDLKLSGVMLAAVVDGNTSNFRIVPAVGSMVLLADMSEGNLRELVVIGWSEIDSISISGGANGGVVIVQNMVDWMKKVYNDLQTLKSQLSLHPVPVSGSPLGLVFAPSVSVPQVGGFENTKFKH